MTTAPTSCELLTVRLIRTDDDVLVDAMAGALLMGIPVDEVCVYMPDDGVTAIDVLPADWLRQGRRRSREAAAHMGTECLVDTLRFWAYVDFGATLVVRWE